MKESFPKQIDESGDHDSLRYNTIRLIDLKNLLTDLKDDF
mgnify:CR=1 FL=1